jgi:transcriptional regulator with XRE-family HTH domain
MSISFCDKTKGGILLTFANNLRQIRDKMGMSQEKFCKFLKDHGVYINQSTLAMYELGYRTPKLEMFFKIATILGVSGDELYGSEVKHDNGKRITGKLKAIPHRRKTLHARLVRKAERRTGAKS